MLDGPPTSHNVNNAQLWLHDPVAAEENIMHQYVEFYASDFGGVHSAFRLMITYAVRRYGFML
jgi:hypothetical protein